MALSILDTYANSTIVLGYQKKDYEGVLKALGEGSMQPEKMITSKIHIDRVVEDGFTPLINVSLPVHA